MSRPAQRLNDSNSAGGSITSIPQGDVFANNLLISVNGSTGTPDSNALPGNPHDGGIWQTANGSGNVFAHSIPINFTDNPDTCDDVRVGGSSNVFLGTDIDQVTPSSIAMTSGDETDAHDPGSGSVYVQQQVAAGNVSSDELARTQPSTNSSGHTTPPDVAPSSTDTTPPKQTPVLSSDCSDIAALFASETPPSGSSIDSISLASGWTVGRITRSPNVVFDHALRSGTGGLELAEIVCNLKLLVVNCIIPIYNQYSNAFITNSWRPAGIGSSKSQHPKGQACDIQFRGISKKDYFSIAQWIKDNVTYDQLLLEYKTTGSGLPWIHISFNKSSNRKQVLTFLNNSTHSQGLTQLA